VLRLETVDDQATELDGGAFGALAHDVLGRFAASPAKDSCDADEIRAALLLELKLALAAQYGRDVAPAVLVQVEQLRLRLEVFAQRQAEWAAAGWRIVYAESHGQQEVDFEVDGQTVRLRGRIDRLDAHPDGRRVVLDYKTSDSAASPDEVHLIGGRWIDLQLPLYRRLADALPGAGPLQLGFVLLPKDEAKTAFVLADWSPEQLQAAEEVARDVIRAVHRQAFWPPAQPPPAFSEAFAAVCQDRVLRRSAARG
jgi:hypothetical protein